MATLGSIQDLIPWSKVVSRGRYETWTQIYVPGRTLDNKFCHGACPVCCKTCNSIAEFYPEISEAPLAFSSMERNMSILKKWIYSYQKIRWKFEISWRSVVGTHASAARGLGLHPAWETRSYKHAWLVARTKQQQEKLGEKFLWLVVFIP